MLVLNLPFKALMFLTLMRPSLVLFLVLWLKLVKDFLRSEERFSRNAETDLVCRLLLEKKKQLAWKLAAVATDNAPILPEVAEMIVNRIIDNAAVAIAAINR